MSSFNTARSTSASFFNIEATLARFVFSEAGHQAFIFQAWSKIENQAGLSRRKACHANLAFPAALVLVPIPAETDDRGAPHLGRLAVTLDINPISSSESLRFSRRRPF